ncbi:MAG TPA: hypothetical protein VG028_14270 [Terriglobia bacterium]|nr:hypothetical protein [Terriglobia bacterium]
MMMTLLDAKPPKPVTGIRKHVPLNILILSAFLIALIAGLVTFRFWNIREEGAVSRFLTTVEQGNYQEAYRLWQPAASYTFDNFVHDWGEKGDYGKIRQFEILGSESKGPITIVRVQINNQNPPLDLVVDRKTLGLAYSNF